MFNIGDFVANSESVRKADGAVLNPGMVIAVQGSVMVVFWSESGMAATLPTNGSVSLHWDSTNERIVKLDADWKLAREEWNTEELMRDFDVIGFSAPFVSVKRKRDHVKGTLEFVHSPRVYFNFREA